MKLNKKDIEFDVQRGGIMIYESNGSGHLVLLTELEEIDSDARTYFNDPFYYKSELQELVNSYYHEYLVTA